MRHAVVETFQQREIEMVNRSYQISELTTNQVAKLEENPKYGSFGPSYCDECGCRAGFLRRVFDVAGAPTDDGEMDKYQNLMRDHMRLKHGLDYVFFRIVGGRQYIEGAVCTDCNSSRVVFDIELSPDMYTELSRRLGAGHRRKGPNA